ncbi:Fungalysin metallopeptidase-domain-containing protein [Cladochytrium replicatum]|nr:Fungalysin metallopeptidase-domain-containing protein [Cladochytrium replicatum]
MKQALLATLALLACATAAPTPSSSTGILPPYYQPPSTSGAPREASSFGPVDPLKIVETYLKSEFGLRQADYVVTSSHTSAVGVTHVYVAQTVNGIPTANGVANINVGPGGDVISMYQSFAPIDRGRARKRVAAPAIGVAQAVASFARASGLPVDGTLTVTPNGTGFIVTGASFTIAPIEAKEAYYQTKSGLILTWELSINMLDLWQNVFVDANTGAVVGVSTWTSDWTESYENISAKASKRSVGDHGVVRPSYQTTNSFHKRDILPAMYNVVPLGKTDPVDNGNGTTTVVSPWDLNASPDGWHFVNGTQSYETRGNNIIAQANPGNVNQAQLPGLPRPNSTALDFRYTYDITKGPIDGENQAVAVVSMFQMANHMHDLFYNYGFDEASGNFQAFNYGKGGEGNDAVLANAQDGSGTNNANFATPADGTPGRMRMYIYTKTTPKRDGALENDVVAHEMTHGLSNRLTGGTANADCLQNNESRGMGEGWSDTFGLFVSIHDDDSRYSTFSHAGWVSNNALGNRAFPYSTDMTVNPHTYNDFSTSTEVHYLGEIWASVLNEVLWNMVDITGRTPTSQIIGNPNAGTGNTDLIKMLILGMKLQPCNPTFIQAKQAILDAEALLFNKKYFCAIHAGFAKRGLGLYATAAKVNDFNIPIECSGVVPDPSSPIPSPIPSPTPIVGPCAHSVCTVGEALKLECNECVSVLCANDMYCCTVQWDSICVEEVANFCPDVHC